MIEVRVRQAIRRPATVVFDFIADPENNPLWQKGMRSARWTSEPPLGVGSTYEQVAHFLGREIRSAFEVAEFDEGRSLRIVSTGGPFPIDVTRSVTETEVGCDVGAVVRGEAGGFFRLASPVLGILVGRSVREDYRRLRDLLEADQG